jgi:amino acid transporter
MDARTAPAPAKFGTFAGVFTPNVLTILGVIMFLRTGWVVGQAGLKDALLILCIANTITLLTSLSLSSIATNLKVGGGGAYFLISRSLGLEVGGSVGLPLFLAQAVSVAFYIIGFTESLHFLFPDVPDRLVSGGVLVALFVISWIGADLAIKTQYFIMAALAASLVSFFAGYTPAPHWRDNLGAGYAGGFGFWSVFAIFFPAVTGIMSGVSMSGDLREPSRSIPRGTVIAVVVTFVIYATQMGWLALNASREELIGNKLVMERIARVGPLIFAGLWAATLSSALASLLAAPRTLQALAQDGIVPRVLGRGSGPTNEPKLALLFSFGLAAACLLLGKLDLVAPIISMFFLAAYGTVNLAAGLSALAANPSYRPTFRTHWALSLIGAAGCFFVMLLLNPIATVAAAVLIAGIFALMKRRQYQTAWGDEWSGIWFSVARFGLLKLAASRQHARGWRPVILVLVGQPRSRLPMVEFATGFEARRGLLFLAHVEVGGWQTLLPLQEQLEQDMEKFIHEHRISAVARSVLADGFEHGVSTLLQTSGVGALEPNTVMIGWSEDALKQGEFVRVVRRVLQLQRNLLIFAEAEVPAARLQPVIDVWWYAKINGGFMLTLAHLLQMDARWRGHRIRLLHVVADEGGREEAAARMAGVVADARIEASPEIVIAAGSLLETISRISEYSAVTFIGLNVPAHEQAEPLGPYTATVAAIKGNIFLAKSWQDLN